MTETRTSQITPPKGERLWVTYYDKNGEPAHIVTSKANNRDVYFLYKINGAKLIRLGESKNPLKLVGKYC
jgi:hypothetical protein